MREHLNIVSLIAWSLDSQSPIKLVMELASYDMEALAENPLVRDWNGNEVSFVSRRCSWPGRSSQIRAGSRDLKSQNILLFEVHGRFVAKLTVFGLAFDENELKDDLIVLGATIGWEAPEVQEGQLPSRTSGTSRQEISLQELEQSEAQIGPEQFTVLHEAVRQCLQHESRDRPLTVLLLLPDGVQLEQNLISQEKELQASQEDDEVTDQALETLAKQYDPFRKVKYEGWEYDPFSKYYVDDLLTCIQKGEERFSPETYFDMFLHLTSRLRNPTISDATVLNLLEKAASLGTRNAPSMVSLMHHYYGIEPPELVRQNHMQWLKRAGSDGSLLGKWDLQHLNHREFPKALRHLDLKGAIIGTISGTTGGLGIHCRGNPKCPDGPSFISWPLVALLIK
ncbi:hypothetical protein N0V90_000586 [Kalmusia sp. IMI 367209]|nr:hypothetical protein N0V90_000586 [Kalmusia sp. IMI 367209]